MMGDLYKKNTCLDFPKGGNEALVDALVRGIEKHPGPCPPMSTEHVQLVSSRATVKLNTGAIPVMVGYGWRVRL